MTIQKSQKICLMEVIATALIAYVLFVYYTTPVAAGGVNWTGSMLYYSEVPNQDLFPPVQPSCIDKTMTLTVARGEKKQANVCLNDKGAWSYGEYSYAERTWWGGVDTTYGSAVRIGSSGDMHRLDPSIKGISAPNSDNIITLTYRADINNYLHVYKNFKDKLHEQAQSDGEIKYTYDTTPDFTLARPNGQGIAVYNKPGISNNGEWAVAETGVGFVRINLDTLQVKRFTSLKYDYTIGYGPSTQFAITNDGQHVAVVGNYNHSFGSHPGYRLYDILDNCGDTITDTTTSGVPMAHPCPESGFESVLREDYSSRLDYAASPHFDDNGGQLTLHAYASGGEPPKWVYLTLDGYTPRAHITYLALGDSYSSGEGDITDGYTHYLTGTGGKGECHISDRSYPFLLREAYSISPENMKSVACSGAQVSFDYMGTDDNYLGQNRQLKGMTEAAQISKRQEVLDNFTAGYIKQLDFVKKYHPAIITLTGGGNDVGFADILKYCAEPYMILGVLPESMTCAYAIPGSKLHDMLYDSIDSQYKTNKFLIEEIQKASPDSRIVIVGYPSFITSEGVCTPIASAGYLDDAERRMINEAESYMNTMLSSLAHDMNVSFVDMTHALDGGRMCEGGKYMTSILDWVVQKADDTERFHPNHLGHSKMAQIIEESDVFQTPNVPQTSSYSLNPNSIFTQVSSFVSGGISKLKHTIRILSDPSIFKPHTPIDITLYSNPMRLGTYMADSEGGFSATIPTKDLPVGYHVLVVEGIGPDGQSVRYYQYVTITDDTIQKSGNTQSVNDKKTTDLNTKNSGTEIDASDSQTPSQLQDKRNITSSGEEGGLMSKEKYTPDTSMAAKKSPIDKLLYSGVAVLIIIAGGTLYYAKTKSHH